MPISPGTHLLYTVHQGDTLSSIANQLGTNVQALIQSNALYPPVADPNRILVSGSARRYAVFDRRTLLVKC